MKLFKARGLAFVTALLALALLHGLAAPAIAAAATDIQAPGPVSVRHVPQAPTNLTATGVSSTRIDLSWTNPAGNTQTGFKIDTATNSAFTTEVVTFTVGPTVTTYSDTSVYPGETFYYRVYAFDTTGNSAYSNIASVTIALVPPAPPAIPSALTATIISDTQVQLSWTRNSANELGFLLDRATDAEFTAGLMTVTVAAATTTYTDTTISAGVRYYYRVAAFNALGNSAYSSAVAVTSGGPLAPTGLSATPNGPTSVALSWTNPAGNTQTGFRIERATNSAFTANLASFTAAGGATTYTDASVAASTSYWFRVFATNASGSSSASNVVNLTTPATATAPLAPTGLTATAAGPTSVDLSWANPAGNTQTGFRLERATDNTFANGLTSFNLGSDVLAYNDITAAGATAYWYRIIAINATGNSPASNVVTVTTPTVVPQSPTGLAAIAAGPTTVNLTWNNPQGNNQTGYRVERATDSAFTANLTSFTTGAGATSYGDSSVTVGTTFYYRVFATNAGGSSLSSGIVSVATSASGPAAPSGLTATAAGAGQVTLGWTNNATNQTGFRIERATDASFMQNLTSFTCAANAVSYNDTSPAAATAYWYRVFATNGSGNSAASNIATVTTLAASSVPPTPTGLTASVVNDSRIDLTWTVNSTNHTGLRIDTATDPTFTSGQITVSVGPAITSYSDTSVYPGATFYYRVYAYNASGNSQMSNVASATIALTTPTPPPAPSGLTAVAVTAAQVNLHWTDTAHNELGTLIDRAADSAFTQSLASFNVPANTTVYSDTTTTAGVTYYYRVIAFNALGNSPNSNTATVTTPSEGVVIPPAPTNLTALAASSTRVNLAWSNAANSNQTGLRLVRATDTSFSNGLTSVTLASGATSYEDSSVSPSTAYCYRIYATTTSATSVASNTATVTTPTVAPISEAPTAPAGPTSLTAASTGAGQVLLTWTNNATNQTGFRIDRATGADFAAGQSSFTATASTTSYTDTAVFAGTTYYYRISATNSAGISAASNTASVTIPGTSGTQTGTSAAGGAQSGIAAPTRLSAVAKTTKRVGLTWTNNATNQTGFKIERATDSNFTQELTTFHAPSNAAGYDDITVAAATTYYYRVLATGATGNSAASNTASINPSTGAQGQSSTAPTAPSALTAEASSTGQVTLRWSSSATNLTGFRIERASDSQFAAGLQTFTGPAGSVSFADTTASTGGTFYYRVVAYSGADASPPSNVASVTLAPREMLPPAPSNLSATASGPTQVDLKWVNGAAKQTAVKLERASDGAFTANLTSFALAGDAVSYTDKTVSASTAYYYRAFANNPIGQSSPSNVATVATPLPPQPPAAPTEFAAVATGNTQIKLAWTNPPSNNQTGFKVERALSADFAAPVSSFNVEAKASSYSDATLALSTTYYYRVFAVNDAGKSPPSATIAVTTFTQVLPSQPSNLTASAGGPTQVNLTWTNPPANIQTGFRIERAADAGFTVALAAFNVGASVTSYSDAACAPATAYFYRVFAFNAVGSSPSSVTASVATPAVSRAPAPPTNLTATVVNTGRVDLTWTNNADNQTGLRVESAADPSFTVGVLSFNASAGATSFTDTSVFPGITFYYRVSAYNAAGASLPSNVASAAIPSRMTPAPPSALAGIAPAPNRVSLGWADNSDNEAGFRIDAATDSGFTAGLSTFMVAANTTSYTDNKPQPGTTYYYRVAAFNDTGDSAPSNTATVTTPASQSASTTSLAPAPSVITRPAQPTVPAAPSSATATAATPGHVTLAWADNSLNEAGFWIERSTDSGFVSGLVQFTAPADATTYDDATVSGDTTYYYRVSAFNDVGYSWYSNTATVKAPAAP